MAWGRNDQLQDELYFSAGAERQKSGVPRDKHFNNA